MSSINILTTNTSDIPFERSFAAHEKSQYWSYKNGDINPRQVFMSSHTKFWFDCKECNHSFENSLNSITNKNNPQWCPYCAVPSKKMCDNKSCNFCLVKSFAMHPKSQFWSSKNGEITPRQVFMSSNKKYWFNCKKCGHEFECSLSNITNKTDPSWCPFCSIAPKQLCNSEDCQPCFERSFASHEKSKYWSSKNGDINPRNVSKQTNKKYWFDCEKCGHEFESSLNSIAHKSVPSWCPFCATPSRQLCNNKNCQQCFEKSFASHEKNKYWSSKNGDLTPRQVFRGSENKYWFDCEKCNHEFEIRPNTVTHKTEPQWCPHCSNKKLCDSNSCQICFEKSFSSHPKSKYWSSKNGEVTPRQLFISSKKKCWFDCEKCNHSFESQLDDITNKNNPTWCPFCVTPPKQLCNNENCQLCFEKSFASHPKSQFLSSKNDDKNPRQVFRGSNKKYWFDCEKCGHDFESMIYNITKTNKPHWCPFCVNKKLCQDENCQSCFEKSFASYPKSQFWSSKNGYLTPREVFISSNKKYWFDCEKCGHDFESRLGCITNKNNPRWCPYCKNKTESKLYDILVNHFPTIIRQFKQEWCRNLSYLPFDFCILEYKIIIELDGRQHFQQIANWRPPEEQYQIDNYKESCANQNGYSVIRIIQEDVWADKYDWLRELLDSIEQLKTQDEPKNIYLHRNNEYQYY